MVSFWDVGGSYSAGSETTNVSPTFSTTVESESDSVTVLLPESVGFGVGDCGGSSGGVIVFAGSAVAVPAGAIVPDASGLMVSVEDWMLGGDVLVFVCDREAMPSDARSPARIWGVPHAAAPRATAISAKTIRAFISPKTIGRVHPVPE